MLAFLELEVESLNRKNKLGLAENYKYSGNSFRDYLSTLHKKDVPLSVIFCFCARGLTFVDFAYLKRENIRHGCIVYERRKTGQYIEVEIQPQMQAFIDKYAVAGGPYLFPVLTNTDIKTAHKQYNSAIRRYNKHLNRLSKMLGLNISLTSYVSRHSWATAAYHADFPVSHISEGMGHTSEKTTRIYLKSLESSKIDRENKRLLDGIFKVALF